MRFLMRCDSCGEALLGSCVLRCVCCGCDDILVATPVAASIAFGSVSNCFQSFCSHGYISRSVAFLVGDLTSARVSNTSKIMSNYSVRTENVFSTLLGGQQHVAQGGSAAKKRNKKKKKASETAASDAAGADAPKITVSPAVVCALVDRLDGHNCCVHMRACIAPNIPSSRHVLTSYVTCRPPPCCWAVLWQLRPPALHLMTRTASLS